MRLKAEGGGVASEDEGCRGFALRRRLLIGVALMAASIPARAAALTPLFRRGYTVIPTPQEVTFHGTSFKFSEGWRLALGEGVKPDDAAVKVLEDDLKKRDGIALETGRGTRVITLVMRPGAVAIGRATDQHRPAIRRQAYRLELSESGIRITANAEAGLFYGAETLIQLVKRANGKFWLPTATITDWPDLENRFIYWDDSHHLERVAAFKRMLRQAAFYKINGVAIKLDGHFQYKSAPAVVEPYALSPQQLQGLTNYGLRFHVKLIPYLDAPAHISFVLKHPEYATLREFPDSNYELCTTNPDTYKLLDGMYRELMDANRGVNYFVLSTDEPYYVGLADNRQCDEAALAKKLGSVGKVEAQFLDRAAGYLHAHGRKVIFWGEYPLEPSDIPSLPDYLINGEVYGPAFDRAFKAHGIREMIYTSTEGVEPLFPNYARLPAPQLFNPVRMTNRLRAMYRKISFDSARQNANLMGVMVAGWGDEGLNPETFWLGYTTGAGWGWHPASPSPQEAAASFYRLFYGSGARDMARVYQLMSTQAEFWNSSWDLKPSTARKPIFGNSRGIFHPRRPALDQTLPLPPVPRGPYLRLAFDWSKANARRVRLAQELMPKNQELRELLHENIMSAQLNRYNLQVFLTIANLERQNLQMLVEMDQISRALEGAEEAAAQVQPQRAVADLDQALALACRIRKQRDAVLQNTVAVWDKSWLPRVAEANGRTYLNEVDDVKDHLPGRTVDMSYLIYRELILPLGQWYRQVEEARNRYALTNGLPARTEPLEWGKTDLKP